MKQISVSVASEKQQDTTTFFLISTWFQVNPIQKIESRGVWGKKSGIFCQFIF